jgi:hypothetical protein
MKICSIEGCGKVLYARGWCEMHYARWHRKGDTAKFAHKPTTQDELLFRFHANVNKTDTCWLWTGCLNNSGYGTINMDGKSKLVHRLAWDLFKSEKIGTAFVLHICDVKNCVNPSHLFSGTQADNMWDKVNKGRHRFGYLNGVHHKNSKLTEDDVRAIRASNQPWKLIAKQFSISVGNVAMIRSRKSWRHLP